MSSTEQLDRPDNPANEDRENGCRETALESVVRRTLQPAEIEHLMEDCARIAADCLGTSHCGMQTDGGLLNWSLCRLEDDHDFGHAKRTSLSLDASRSLHGYALKNAHTVVTDDLDAEERFDDELLG